MKQWDQRQVHAKYMPYVLAFLIPLAVMAAVCIGHGIYPFGENSFLHIDMYHQYAPFFMEFLHKLKAHESLMFSWDLGIGSDFVATFAYYLASPVNWLLFFCPENCLIEFMTVLVLLKIAFSGLFFAVYLGYHFKNNSYLVTLVSMFYALSAFISAYSWNIMWLDCIMLTPLIILGLERLFREKKSAMYCVLLAVSILSNYYISIMICIFLVLYFLVMQVEQKHLDFKSCLRFGFYSLLAGGMGAVLLLPEAIALGYSGSGGFSFPEDFSWYFSIFDELARHCMGVTVYTGRDHWPNIYCGVAVLLLVVLYLLNRRISWKKKLLRFLALAFFLVSFANNWLDFIWHGLHFPDSLPGRQSFLYMFVLLVMAFDELRERKGNRIWHIVAAAAACGAFLVCTALFTDHEMISMDAILMTAVFLLAYTLLFVIVRMTDAYRTACYCMVFFLAIAETGVNMDLTGVVTTSRTQYTAHWEDYKALNEQAAEQADGFYRIEKWDRMTKNESSLTGYRSASLFSSLMNYSVGTFYRELGMEGGKNYYCYNGATPLLSAMLSVKYMMTASADEESPLRTLAGESGGIFLYENKYVLPLGFTVPADLEDNWDFTEGTAVMAQNSLVRQLGAGEDLFCQLPVQKNAGETVINVTEDSYVYASYGSRMANTITADIGGKRRTFTKCSHVYLLDLGWCKAGTQIKLTSPEVADLMVQAYTLNFASLDTAYNRLNAQTMTLDEFSDRSVKGHITMQTTGKLVFSIPCEDGWTLFVDGKETGKEMFLNSLIGVTLQAGSHEIELRYETPGLRKGAAISGASAVLFVFVTLFLHKRSKKRKKTRTNGGIMI